MLGSGPEGLHTQDTPHTSCRGEKQKPTSVKRENTVFNSRGGEWGFKMKRVECVKEKQ